MAQLENLRIPTKLKLSALWAATIFCYLYCDYFELYVPGKLQSMLDGRIEPLGAVTQSVLVGTSILMAIPSLMVALSVLLGPKTSRIANIVFGVFFTAIMCLLAYQAGWYFYKLFAVIEAILTATIVWIAWKWPEAQSAV